MASNSVSCDKKRRWNDSYVAAKMKSIARMLRDPMLDQLGVNGVERLDMHAGILSRKPILKKVFSEFHKDFRRLDERFLTADGARIELGAGVAPIRDTYPDVLATDIVPSDKLDRILDAEAMDLPDDSVRAVYGQNCFHHFPHPDRFFGELLRVLAPGGGAVLLEPYYGPLASLLYKRLFSSEGFDKKYPSWEAPIEGPMHGANQALSYVVFVRDRAVFEAKFPALRIVHTEQCANYLGYFLSGGLNFRQLWPNSLSPVIGFMQRCLMPFNSWLALHHIIVIRKELR